MVMRKFAFIILLTIPFHALISQTLDQDYYTSVTANTSFSINSVDDDNGQSFTSGITGDLTSIRVVVDAEDVLNSCSPGDETVLQMELHAGDGFGGSILGTSNNVTVLDGHNALTEFVFSTAIAVVSGSMYTFEVNIVSEDCGLLFTNLEAVLNGTYPNGTGYNAGLPHTSEIMFQTYVISSLSTEEHEHIGRINMYPNPVRNFLHLVNVKNLNSTKIFNNLGQLVLETKENKIDFSRLNRGVYILQIDTFNEIVSKKIIKQ